MKNNHTFLKFQELTKSRKFEQKQNQELTPNFINDFKIESEEYCRVVALSEILNISYEKLINILISNALGDAHEGFLSAFCSEKERDIYNQQLKQRVKELLSLS